MSTQLQQACQSYLGSRISDYAFRCRRFRVVYNELVRMGFARGDSVLDLGAGRQDFKRFLREQGWYGLYVPIDGAIDGTDLNTWSPSEMADFVVAIEVAEHLLDPYRFLAKATRAARRGCVMTTPNPEVVDVIACDPTHVSVVDPQHPYLREWVLSRHNLFGLEGDTLVARYWRFTR